MDDSKILVSVDSGNTGNGEPAIAPVPHCSSLSEGPTALGVSWRSIKFKSGETEILKDVHGSAPAGNVLAIVGPSGAGKTSLMNLLAGKFVGGVTSGIISFSTTDMLQTVDVDTLRSSPIMRDHISLVEQFDIFIPELTMREHLHFHARIRLRKQSSSDRAEAVERVAILLRVQNRLDTRIKLLSGGEKKRVAIAEELLNDPPLLLLDEPTSGLDSFVAAEVIKVLTGLPCTVILTIHQPSSSIYNSFDNVLLLAQGEVCYYGPPDKLVDSFAACNAPCPIHVNPAEYALEALAQDDIRKRLAVAAARCQTPVSNGVPGTRISDGTPKNSDSDEVFSRTNSSFLLVAKPRPGYWVEIHAVLWRTFLERRRKRLATRLQILSTVIVSLFAASVYWRLDYSQEAVKSRIGALLFFMLHPIFSGVFESVMIMVMAHPMLVREFRVKHLVRLPTFYLARTFGELLIQMLFPLLYVCIGFWMINFSSSFLRFVLFWAVLSVGVFHGISLGYFIGTLGTDMDLAITYAIIIIIPMFIFSGFLVEEEIIVSWLAWLKNFSPFYWTYRGLMVIIWDGVGDIADCLSADGCSTRFVSGADILRKNHIDPDNAFPQLQLSVAMNLALAIMWRLLAYMRLHIRHIWDDRLPFLPLQTTVVEKKEEQEEATKV
eukprot:GEMP01023950.1.p1 GENE.GEMP01023950.1~~GEMP01023950.1.p1  ORF type:complete len:661 (+),score=141.06 GEMP01023950.1:215-2197(+)